MDDGVTYCDPFIDQQLFMRACDQTVNVYNPLQFDLYTNLIKEEYRELKQARDDIETLDALVDILVVTIGAIYSMGADPRAAWQEVMKTNFAKIDSVTGRVMKRSDGKVLKPLDWVPPDLSVAFANREE
jgi:predicted HAD superfamily Cof-like phosphohydrolase